MDASADTISQRLTELNSLIENQKILKSTKEVDLAKFQSFSNYWNANGADYDKVFKFYTDQQLQFDQAIIDANDKLTAENSKYLTEQNSQTDLKSILTNAQTAFDTDKNAYLLTF